MPPKSGIATVYLARAGNGLAPFQNFLQSYAHFPGGMPNDLVIVFKGFKTEREAAAYSQAAAPFAPKTLFMRDFGFDLRAYELAARQFDHPLFCFFNSFSEILDRDWLAKMYAFIRRPEVGVVGATGSHESMYANALRDHDQRRNAAPWARMQSALRVQLCRHFFDPFPNPHLRTNAFLVARELMLQVWPRLVLTKRGAYLFENGKHGFAKRIMRRGLKVLVVGRDGRAFEKEDWARSQTFRAGEQKNLLVADNQTRQYAEADSATRQSLSRITWGEPTNPLPAERRR